MSIYLEAKIADAFGVPLTTVADFADAAGGSGIDVALSVGTVGTCILTTAEGRTPTLFQLDGRIGIWRSIAGRPPALDGEAIFLIRDFEAGPSYRRYTAYHANELLERRIIAYPSGSSYTAKTAAADNVIRALIRENMGSLVNASRDGAETGVNVSSLVGVQPDLGLGPTVSMAATRRNLALVIQELANAATTAGTYLVAEVVAATPTTLEARVYAGQRGRDRRASTATPIILSEQRGTLQNVIVRESYRNEITVVVAGGSGEGANRQIQVATNGTRLAASPLNRREAFIEDGNIDDLNVLLDKAEAALRANAPTVTMTADLVETPGVTRGIHFDLGDYVTAEAYGKQYDVRVNVLRYTYAGGQYRSTISLRGTL